MNTVFSWDEICKISLPIVEKYGVAKLYVLALMREKKRRIPVILIY